MPKVTMRKCRFTNAHFDTDAKFLKHLKRLRLEQKEKRKDKAMQRDLSARLINIRQTVATTDELAQAILDNWDLFVGVAKYNYHWDDRKKAKWPKLVDIAIKDVQWSNCVSNSHNAPIGKKTNWGRRDPAEPTGYPGLTAHLVFSMDHDVSGFTSSFFEHPDCAINTGSGGTWNEGKGAIKCHYYLELFAADWPGIADTHTKKLLWDIMTK